MSGYLDFGAEDFEEVGFDARVDADGFDEGTRLAEGRAFMNLTNNKPQTGGL